jgi:hypothetical protein
MKTSSGRFFIGYLIYDLLGLKSLSYSVNGRDSLTFFNDGRRYAAKIIEELVEKHAPENLGLLEGERRAATKATKELRTKIESDAALTDERDLSDV